ncbi:MAG: ABC transporter substrate-binding protein [Candidatus Riflebacteria bacterium]|nr:ABC transporter substrate-binding protein [Candidatus Riflebacteria bacterium]
MKKILLFALVISVCILTGCGKDEKKENQEICSLEPVSGGTYIRAFPSAVLTLDPRDIGDSFSHEVSRQIFDGLVEFRLGEKSSSEKTLVVPSLAKSWTISEDRLTYTFELQNDARFHAEIGSANLSTANKGRLLSAEDVSYTFHRLLHPDSKTRRAQSFLVIKGAKAFSERNSPAIEGINVISSHSISFSLEKPFAPFLSLLALSNAFIVPREDIELSGEGFSEKPVGTGPFIFAGKKGDTIILRANPVYFKGKPYLDKIEFPVMKAENEIFNSFMKGNLSQSNVPDPEYRRIINDKFWSKYFQEASRWGTFYLGFNVKIPPFDNVKVRQAINYAIDRDTIVNLILNGRARMARGVLPPGIMNIGANSSSAPKSADGTQIYSFDPVKAKALLIEAGYGDGKEFPEITLQFNADPSHTRTSEFILANLRDVGIACKLKIVDFKEHLDKVEKGEVGFFRMGWTADYPDPDNFLYTLFHTSNIGSEGNFSRYSNPIVDDLLERARFEVDPKIRIPLYEQIEQIIVNDAPWVFISHYTTHVLLNPNIRNFELTPLGAPFVLYRQIWIDPLSPTYSTEYERVE